MAAVLVSIPFTKIADPSRDALTCGEVNVRCLCHQCPLLCASIYNAIGMHVLLRLACAICMCYHLACENFVAGIPGKNGSFTDPVCPSDWVGGSDGESVLPWPSPSWARCCRADRGGNVWRHTGTILVVEAIAPCIAPSRAAASCRIGHGSVLLIGRSQFRLLGN